METPVPVKKTRPKKDPVPFPKRKIDPKKVDPQEVVQMILDVYDQAMTLNKYTEALQATKQLGDYLNLFESKASQTTNIVNITDRAAFDKDLERLSKAAGIKLLEAPKDAEFSEVPNSGSGSAGTGDRGVVEVDREGVVWKSGPIVELGK